MKKTIISFLMMCLCIGLQVKAQGNQETANDNSQLLISHLKANFDDIHDVSMRFHHLDHKLNGTIELDMLWINGKLSSSKVVKNETGNDDFAKEMQKAIAKWEIPELSDTFKITLPLRVMIFGSDDPSYTEKAICTGTVKDNFGNPVYNAKVTLVSSSWPKKKLKPCYTNREGIFVKTLIPPGEWTIKVEHTECKKTKIEIGDLSPGYHSRQDILLKNS